MHADTPGCQACQQTYCQLSDSAAVAVVCPAGLTIGVSSHELLFLGRQDYVMRSVRLKSKAETWNATFSKLFVIPAGAPGTRQHQGIPAGRTHGSTRNTNSRFMLLGWTGTEECGGMRVGVCV